MLCVLFLCMSNGNYRLKSIPNANFWETFFMAILFILSFCQKSAERNRRNNTSCSLFWYLAWGSNQGKLIDFTELFDLKFELSNKPTHYLLDYENFIRMQVFGHSLIIVTFLPF